MQRKDLLLKNAEIFRKQGKALAAKAASDVRVLIVGNPCNTNCLIAYHNGLSIPAERWTAMTRLDHNRAVGALAKKAGVGNSAVTCMTIWGNHSNTQYPDFTNAKINGKPAAETITEAVWPSSARAICASDLPSCRTLANPRAGVDLTEERHRERVHRASLAV